MGYHNKIALLFLFSFMLACKGESEKKLETEPEQERPNIIFIMADDHAVQAISAYNDEMAKLAPTPNIDRLAKNGAIFQNNFCTNALCGPSRAVILTGNHSHINGFRMNGQKFDNSQQTLPKILQKNGYRTAIVGKWHLNGYPTGFDYWKILKDQGKYYNPLFIQMSDSATFDEAYANSHPDTDFDITDTTLVEGYATDLITKFSLDWLKKADTTKPFFLMVHHKAPHRNWMPALRHVNLYDSIDFPVPDNYFSEHKGQLAAQEQLQTIYKHMYEGHDLRISKHCGTDSLAANPWTNDFDRMTPEQREIFFASYRKENDAMHMADLNNKEMALWKYQRYMAEYLETVAAIDEGVGKILDYLEASGLDENTLVVYTSDQGFFLGEHGFFDKRFMYEESIKMALLMQYPGKIEPGTVVNTMTQNLDYAPTFLDYAGLEAPQKMQGRSFKGLLEGNPKFNREAIYYHYYDFPAFHMVKRHYGIRTDRYKLMHFYDDIDDWEFYDLKNDPTEEHNAYNDPEYQEEVALLKQKLDSLQERYKVTDAEFKTSSPEAVKKAYQNFKRMRGEPMYNSKP